MNDETVQRKLAAIFYADVVGYSKLMRDDEMATVKTITEYREVFINLIRQYRGRIVDSSGDNILAEFPSVVDAIQGAVSIQKELKARNDPLAEHRRMLFRIGINIGDVIAEQDRIYGDGVNIAARLEALALPGGICISRMAYDQIESKLPLGYEYMGEQMVKNIDKPLYAYRVIIDPEEKETRKKPPPQAETGSSHEQPRTEFGGENIKHSFRQIKQHITDFARDIKDDEQIGDTFQDIKGRFNAFKGEVSGRPEQRQRAFQDLLQHKHLRVYLGLALFLLIINIITSFGSWWFQYPLVSIGLAFYLHWLKVSFFSPEKLRHMHERLFDKELSGLDAAIRNTEQGRAAATKKVNDRMHFNYHFFVFIGVNAFLFLINMLTSPFNWWFHFPLIGWGFGLFFHWMKLR